MKQRIVLSIIVIINGCSLFAQDNTYFAATDAKALRIPKEETASISSLAGFINSNFKTEQEKIRAAYVWVIHNIQYDKDSMYIINRLHDPDSTAEATLRRRKGVCENFASLFSVLVSKAGILSYTVYGYSKTGGITDWGGHCWTAVYANNEWLLCDPTWETVSGNGDNFFLIKPDDFIQTHMPFDALWQLRTFIITNKEFYKNAWSNKKDKPFFNYTDSIKEYLQMDSISRLRAATRRMRDAGLDNEILQTWYLCYEMKISIIYEEKDMNLYNDAVADYNKAKDMYNAFIIYRNNMMKPVKPDEDIAAMLNGLDAVFSSAYIKIDAISAYSRDNQYNPSSLLIQLEALRKKVKAQKDFLKKYLSVPVSKREKLLYE